MKHTLLYESTEADRDFVWAFCVCFWRPSPPVLAGTAVYTMGTSDVHGVQRGMHGMGDFNAGSISTLEQRERQRQNIYGGWERLPSLRPLGPHAESISNTMGSLTQIYARACINVERGTPPEPLMV